MLNPKKLFTLAHMSQHLVVTEKRTNNSSHEQCAQGRLSLSLYPELIPGFYDNMVKLTLQ